MDPLLKNPLLDSQLQKDGFVKLQFLSEQHIERIAKLYEETRLEHEAIGKNQAFHATQDCANWELTQYIDKKAKEILSPIIEENFVNHRIIMANFILKEPGLDSALTPHQDWTFVDESKFGTFGFWTPIDDTHSENGNLQFLPGSQKILPTLRVNYNYTCAFDAVLPEARKYMQEVTTKKGESVLLNHSVLHGSRPNLSAKTRVALTLGITHKDAQLYHYFCEDGKTVFRYKINLEILEKLKYKVRPEDKHLDEVFTYNFPSLSKEDFEKWIQENKLIKTK